LQTNVNKVNSSSWPPCPVWWSLGVVVQKATLPLRYFRTSSINLFFSGNMRFLVEVM
jgi:hypothetical protein